MKIPMIFQPAKIGSTLLALIAIYALAAVSAAHAFAGLIATPMIAQPQRMPVTATQPPFVSRPRFLAIQ